MASSDRYEGLLKGIDQENAAVQDLSYYSDTYENLYSTASAKYNHNCHRRRQLLDKSVQLKVQLNTVQNVIATLVRKRNSLDARMNTISEEISESQKSCFELAAKYPTSKVEMKMQNLDQEFDFTNLKSKRAESRRTKNMLKDTMVKNLEKFKRNEEVLQRLNHTPKFEQLREVVESIAIDEDGLKRKEMESLEMSNFIKKFEAKLRSHNEL